ncbi:MAG: magnesium-translocating P-type ATPase, partial [Patescibacteria group bacterium]
MQTDTKIKKTHLGLTSREAARRLRRFGPNQVYRKPRLRPIIAFIKKFNSPLLLILIFASIVSIFLGQRTNAVIILLMVFLSAVLDFINTFRSEKAVEKLNAKIVTTVTVLRDGEEKKVELINIVPGDVIKLSAGSVVPADARVISADGVFVNQATLTGESFPVLKTPPVAGAKKDSSDDPSSLFMGTSLVTGFCLAEVLKTGSTTEFGKIALRLAEVQPETEFDRGIRQFSVFIMKVTSVLVAFSFLTTALLGRGVLQSFIFAVAIAIGLTPELLPVVMSVSLSRGSILMAKKDVVVKHLPSIQNFGSMNVLCTDKTGTLTEDRIVLVKHIDSFGHDSEKVLLYSYLSSFYHTGIANPLDAAIIEYHTLNVRSYKKIDEIPFDFERKRSSLVVRKGRELTLISKGAPEDIIKVCRSVESSGRTKVLDISARKRATNLYRGLSKSGFRVLGVAAKKIGKLRSDYSNTFEEEMVLVGFVAFLDPPKETATKAILDLEKLGVEVKILTGDSEILTQKICRDIGLSIRGVVTGKELEALNEAQLRAKLTQTTIFARVTPSQKEKLILAIKKQGNVVGYLGDGINDAPALAAADVGISVSNAVDVAKETADIILIRKSLRVLRDGVLEGRKTFANTIKYIYMGLSSNFGNMFSMSLMPLFLNFLPMLPSQILFNNFLYDASQVTLATDRVDEDDIQKPPRWNFGFIKKYMMVFGPISSVFDFLTVWLLYSIFKVNQSQFQAGWFMESLATQILVLYIIRTKKIPFLQSRPSSPLLATTLAAVLIGWLIPFSPLASAFGFSPLPLLILAPIIGLIAVYLIIVELTKRVFFKWQKVRERVNIPV